MNSIFKNILNQRIRKQDYLRLNDLKLFNSLLRNVLNSHRSNPYGNSDNPYDINNNDNDINNNDNDINNNDNGMHFLLFPQTENLSPDGYSSLFTPPPPFIHRMWLGGSLNFHKNLVLKKDYHLDGRCLKIREKDTTRGKAIITGLKNEITDNDGLVLEEFRNLIYLSKPIPKDHVLTDVNNSQNQHNNQKLHTDSRKQENSPRSVSSTSLKCRANNLDLFQFSKLTHNCHKIHYDLNYAREEGYKDLLVHGPLLTCLMLEFIHIYGFHNLNGLIDNRSGTEAKSKLKVKQFEYQCLSPCFVNEEFTINGSRTATGFKVWINSGKQLIARGNAQFVVE